MCKIAQVLVALILTIIGYKDWRSKRISCFMLVILAIMAIVFRLTIVRDTLWSTVGGMGIGILFLLISRYSGEAIGYGDSWIILLLGIFVGGKALFQIVLGAAFLAAIVALIFCIRKGWKRSYTVPFVPFLAMAYVGVTFL